MIPSARARSQLLERALRLEYLTVGWNVIEGVVAVGAALAAGSVALLGFGVDSFVESVSGVILMAVNVQESGGVVRDHAATYGLTYRIALDPTAGAFRRWGVFGLPTHHFIGRDGLIRDRWFGPLSLAEMERRIDLIAED